MNKLKLVNSQNQTAAEIGLDEAGQLRLTVHNAALAAGLGSFVEHVQQHGVALRVAKTLEKDGQPLIIDGETIVTPEHPAFLKALADEINSLHFGKERVFALIQN